MKITLSFDDGLAPEAEEIIIEWIKDLIDNITPNRSSPLKYVKKDGMEVQRDLVTVAEEDTP